MVWTGTTVRKWAGAWLAVFVAACGGTQYDGAVYKNDDVSFRIGPPPASWRTIQSDEALIAFRDDGSRATIAVNARCGQDGDDVPLRALTHHLFLQFTERDLESSRELMIDGRAALETKLVARLDGVPKHFWVYVLKKNGCVYDFLRIGEVGAGESPEFASFVESFHVLSDPAGDAS